MLEQENEWWIEWKQNRSSARSRKIENATDHQAVVHLEDNNERNSLETSHSSQVTLERGITTSF